MALHALDAGGSPAAAPLAGLRLFWACLGADAGVIVPAS